MTPSPQFEFLYSAKNTSIRKKGRGIFFLALLLLSGGLPSTAEAGSAVCPPEYGKVLYECNPAREKQLFIIGMGHRDGLTGANGRRTARIQAEVYKLGEWLIRQEGVEMVLPEGFFKDPGPQKTANPAPSAPSVWEKRKTAEPLDLQTLEAKLAEKTTFLNAEILWKRNYPIVLQQVEDKKCYEEVGAMMSRLFGGECSRDEYVRRQAELALLQDKRTALMLQKIPGIIDREYAAGRIMTRKAIFTIGLSHILPILKYLSQGGIRYSSPPAGNHEFQALNLQRQEFRVSILIPQSLAEDRILLEINGLGKEFLTTSPYSREDK